MKNVLSFLVMMLFVILFTGLMSRCSMFLEEVNVEESKADLNAESLAKSSSCSSCDHIVNSYLTDGKALNIKPGDVICLEGGVTYDRLVFRNIVGTKNEPVVIRNCGGVAIIYSKEAFGLKFENSSDFKLIGDGSSNDYGIKVTTEKGFYISMEKFTTDFEITRVEVAGVDPNGLSDRSGFAGIGVKTSPYQDCDLFKDPTRMAWIMKNIDIHHNYIHDTGGEGIYMGHGFYKGKKESNCSSITYSHSIQGVKIYNNLIANVGYDGIQIKNADKDVEVFKNIIRNYGTKKNNAHNEGLFIGEGTTGEFYKNIVDTGTGNGCQIQGLGNLTIFNNIIINSGENGIYATNGTYVVRLNNGFFNILNNTIYNSSQIGFVFYNELGGPKRFQNNLVVKAGTLVKNGANVMMKNNILTNDAKSILFSNEANKNLHLKFGSPGIDAGINLSGYGVTTDFDGKPRPSGKAFDIGAYEYRVL